MAKPRLICLALSFLLAACAVRSAPCAPRGTDVVYVIDHGWHTDIGVPVSELSGPVAVFRTVFPDAGALEFGFGKRTFFTAKVDSWREYLLGPIPGPAAILVTGLRVMPDAAYGAGETVVLHLPAGGAERLSAFLWHEFAKDSAGKPRLIAPGTYPGGLFYAATATYTLAETCNTWTADALHAAGLPISGDGVVFAGQAMRRVRAAALCPMPPLGADGGGYWQGGAAPLAQTAAAGAGMTTTLAGGGLLAVPNELLHAAMPSRAEAAAMRIK